MKQFLVTFFLLGCISNSLFAQTPGEVVESGQQLQPPSSFALDPISTAGHGALFDQQFKPIKITPAFIRRTIDYYVDNLSQEAEKKVTSQLVIRLEAIEKTTSLDHVTKQFLKLDYLIRETNPPNKIQLEVRSRILRKHWYKVILGEKQFKEVIDVKTYYPYDILKPAEGAGVLFFATSAAGAEYRAECREAGVPIPPTWGAKDQWNYEGDLSTNFLGFGSPAEVWTAYSDEPKGICVALPRIGGGEISALGIICLGTESNNACFYDASDVPIGAEKPIEEFLAGNDLFNGVCTDCHAGENPYVVHPSGPLNLAPDNMGTAWYKPLIKPSWPQNPGPLTLLELVELEPSDSSCLDCHAAGDAGRFPDILALNTLNGAPSGYCTSVLFNAVGNTMPGPGGSFDKHVQAMLSLCSQELPPSGEVPNPDVKEDPEIVSPPVVIAPLYACASAVEISGGIYGAELIVHVNDVEVATVGVTKPSQTIVDTGPLNEGDEVKAVQVVSGVMSDPSVVRTVVHYTVDYPAGLPRPEIDPRTVYECGRTIAVRHVRGAKVTVFTNGVDEASYTTGGDWTNLRPRIRPFVLGDRYTAQQSLCGDVSAISNEEAAALPPSPMPTPAFDPTPPLAGQSVVHIENLAEGALTVVSEASAGDLSTFSTAVTWQPEVDVATGLGRPIVGGDSFVVVSSLCEDTKTEIPEARPCENLEAPRIATPVVGQTQITVTRSEPGARILVYDQNGIEIADGSGTIVGLTRAIEPGDVLIVLQRLEDCVSSSAYQTGVICLGKEQCG